MISNSAFLLASPIYPPSPRVTFLLCVCACVCVCVGWIQFYDYIIYYFWSFTAHVIVDFVKRGALILVSEIRSYRIDCYYYYYRETKQRNSTVFINRHGINHAADLQCNVRSTLLTTDVWKLWKYDCECSRFVPRSLYQWCHEQGQRLQLKYQTRCEPAFFCSSTVKSKQSMNHGSPKELKIETKHKKETVFCSMSLDI